MARNKCALDILFSSNHNIHKSSFHHCFWASDPLIERFNNGQTNFYERCDLTKKVYLVLIFTVWKSWQRGWPIYSEEARVIEHQFPKVSLKITRGDGILLWLFWPLEWTERHIAGLTNCPYQLLRLWYWAACCTSCYCYNTLVSI